MGIDRQRVFAAGFSNGAAMVYRLACERPDRVAAVAPVYTIEGGGHAWPGGKTPVPRLVRGGTTPRDFDAAAVIWDFFQKHPRRGAALPIKAATNLIH